MDKIFINGGNPLKGEVNVSGAKNAVLAILPAAILAQDVCVIENVPDISDVAMMVRILHQLGARVKYINDNTLEIDTSTVNSYVVTHEMTKHMRASYYLIGTLISRFGRAKVAMPGGCNFGVRPIDQHIKGFEALGARVIIENGMVDAKAKKLSGERKWQAAEESFIKIKSSRLRGEALRELDSLNANFCSEKRKRAATFFAESKSKKGNKHEKLSQAIAELDACLEFAPNYKDRATVISNKQFLQTELSK